MKIYIMEYSGSWLGGNAVVLAGSIKTAKKILQEDPVSKNCIDIEVKKTFSLPRKRGIMLYNDNGDY